MNATIDLRPAADRSETRMSWLDSRHSFSFGPHDDPDNTGHGLLIVSNDDRVAPGGGFGAHGHRDMEIVTWVLDGALEHRDSAGNEGVITPGQAQRMSAGRGIVHSEQNHADDAPVHFIQMWVVPDRTGIEPGYEQLDVSERLATGDLVPVASGRGHDGAVTINQAGAVMWAGRPPGGRTLELPDAPFVHVFVARGTVELGDRTLEAGDAARLTDAGPISITAVDAAEVIVWESDQAVRR